MKYISKGLKDTAKIAADLAHKIQKKKPGKKAVFIALEGELGAGKTTFAKAFAKALGVRQRLTSPTFVILKSYKLKAVNYNLLCHIDAYPLKDHTELIPIGIKELFADPQAIILLEWPERVAKILPKDALTIHIDHIDSHSRRFTIS